MSNESGRHPRVTVAEIRDAIRDADEIVLDTGELADLVGLARSSLNERMDDILADEAIHSKQVGRTRVFWHTNLQANKAFADIQTGREETTVEDEEIISTIGFPEIDSIDFPGRGEALILRKWAVWIAIYLIYANGRIESKTLKDTLWNDPFKNAYDSQDGFWNNVISPSLSKYSKLSDGEVLFEKNENAWYTFEKRKKEVDEVID